MPTYLAPGVYFEELAYADDPKTAIRRRLPPAVGPDSALPAAHWIAEHTHTAFLGFAQTGPFLEPMWIHNWTQFQQMFGDHIEGAVLAHAVYGFFANGGQSCVVARLGSAEHDDRSTTSDAVEALRVLERVDDVSLLCAPDIMNAYGRGHLGVDDVRGVQLGMIAHAELMGDRLAILDPPPGLDPSALREWRQDVTGYDSDQATLYYPWLKVHDPYSGMTVSVPPSGHVAGVYARTDLMRGFHHTPANQSLTGVLGLERHIAKFDIDHLNPVGVNALVTSASRGAVVWGSRTLSSDPDRRYIRRRRVLSYILRNLRRGTSWAIFERLDDPNLKPRVANEIHDFLDLLWRSGALWGETPEEAFWVGYEDDVSGDHILRVQCLINLERDYTSHFQVVLHCD